MGEKNFNSNGRGIIFEKCNNHFKMEEKKMLFKFCVMNGDSRIIREKHLHSHSPLINKYVARIAHGFLDL
jgi:hypothetical protein